MHWYRNTQAYLPLFNEAGRTAMRLKYLLDRYRVKNACRGKEKEIQEWFAQRDIFFGFASFRSGTVSLTNLLKSQLSDCHIEHEANVDDYWNYPQAMANPTAAYRYIRDFRINEIYTRAEPNCRLYGEINPFLRLHCKALKELLPQAKLFHIIRDGRNVVRSTMSREVLSKKDPLQNLIKPPVDDPYRDKWPQMTRFERVCWQWQYDNRFMRENVSHCIHFEEMLSDYDYFKAKICDYLNVKISADAWQRYRTARKNVTPEYQIPSWQKWEKEKLASFETICGQEMAAYGYR